MTASDEPLGITLFEVSKAFGRLEALADFSLRVARGEVVAIFGPNGAGKTTLIRIAAGLASPSHGRVLVDGLDVHGSPARAKRRIGFAGDRPLLYGDLTAQENLEFCARLYGASAAEARERAQASLGRNGLAHRAADPAGTLSHGMAKRLSIARAAIHQPTVLLLDEPFEGLDARSCARLVSDLRAEAARAGRAVMLSTHQAQLGLAACDRAALMDRGRLVKVLPRATTQVAALSRELEQLGGESDGK